MINMYLNKMLLIRLYYCFLKIITRDIWQLQVLIKYFCMKILSSHHEKLPR